jgi:hypothetical protein
MVHRQHPSRMRRKYRTINMCGNLCHLPLSVRHTEARAMVLQKETREEGETAAAAWDLNAAVSLPAGVVRHERRIRLRPVLISRPRIRPLHRLSGAAAAAAKQSNNSSAPSRTNFICATASSSSLAASPSGAPATRRLWPATRPPHSELR